MTQRGMCGTIPGPLTIELTSWLGQPVIEFHVLDQNKAVYSILGKEIERDSPVITDNVPFMCCAIQIRYLRYPILRYLTYSTNPAKTCPIRHPYHGYFILAERVARRISRRICTCRRLEIRLVTQNAYKSSPFKRSKRYHHGANIL